MEHKESSEKHSFLDSITGNRRVAIASGIVLTVIVIFGLLMTRQILFFDVNVETIFFHNNSRSWIWYNLMDFVEVYRKNNCRVAVKVSLYTQHPDGN
jgi:hypothetical protein